MSRTLFAFFAFALLCSAQIFPAFRWISEIDASGSDQLAGLATDSQGNIYLAGTTQSPNFRTKAAAQARFGGDSDVFVTKLDPDGNIVYSTYMGGAAGDVATAMTAGSDGSVYVTGTTGSADFPTTPGAYSPAVPAASIGGGFVSFLFKLNPDGSVAWSTYFTNSPTSPNAIAVDAAGFVSLAGLSYGGLATTPGAYKTSCSCVPPGPGVSFFAINDAFLARFNPAGSQLVLATYLGTPLVANALALAADGSACIAGTSTRSGSDNVFLLNPAGTALLASAAPGVRAQVIAVAPDGSLYLAGPAASTPNPFVPAPGAFQSDPGLSPDANAAQNAIVRMDGRLQGTLAGTWFGGALGTGAKALALDAAGHVYVGGYTSPRSLPTRTPFVQGFGISTTGYVAEFTADLSTLLFSSEFGDNEVFGVNGLAIGTKGNVILGGATGEPLRNLWANSLVLADPNALRIDSVQNAASGFSDPVVAGETIRVRGAGFGAGARLSIDGINAITVSIDPTVIVAIVPPVLPRDAVTVQVVSDRKTSNSVLLAVAAN